MVARLLQAPVFAPMLGGRIETHAGCFALSVLGYLVGARPLNPAASLPLLACGWRWPVC
ncbi:hypothetical protein [Paludibacterium purpuratum]|nr:hypothetical protein [Paludibacterium purpuratum]